MFVHSFVLRQNERTKEKLKAAETMIEHFHLFRLETNFPVSSLLLVTRRDSDSVSRFILCDENVPGVIISEADKSIILHIVIRYRICHE